MAKDSGTNGRALSACVIALADPCHYRAECRKDQARQRPLESWNLADVSRC
jgi:hypothetical protein